MTVRKTTLLIEEGAPALLKATRAAGTVVGVALHTVTFQELVCVRLTGPDGSARLLLYTLADFEAKFMPADPGNLPGPGGRARFAREPPPALELPPRVERVPNAGEPP
jgi:hypothetical protein